MPIPEGTHQAYQLLAAQLSPALGGRKPRKYAPKETHQPKPSKGPPWERKRRGALLAKPPAVNVLRRPKRG